MLHRVESSSQDNSCSMRLACVYRRVHNEFQMSRRVHSPGFVILVTMSTQSLQPEFVRLYERAFKEFGTMALWSSRPVENPTPADALAITRSLRVEGNLEARRLAEQIEQACHAAV